MVNKNLYSKTKSYFSGDCYSMPPKHILLNTNALPIEFKYWRKVDNDEIE